jgi:hypothetical protein
MGGSIDWGGTLNCDSVSISLKRESTNWGGTLGCGSIARLGTTKTTNVGEILHWKPGKILGIDHFDSPFYPYHYGPLF